MMEMVKNTLGLLLWLLLCLAFSACAPATDGAGQARTGAEAVPALPGKPATDPALKEQWGIEVTSLAMSAGGHMVDFRFRVLDSEKAASLFKRANKPYLIDQASGQVLAVPRTAKIGPLRSSDPPREDRIYWMFFGTVPGLVKTGSLVTVVIGDFRAENLVVQ
ncbi:MAG: hypothetical protein RBR09_03480 [Desulfobulbaceae bacterium]|jgi:hypothetical protein|nr:hypothetical protein [Desulfobulbaceae bacterium]